MTVPNTLPRLSTSPELHIDSFGQGQDLVMLHGWGTNSGVFSSIKDALSQYRVHYVDLPGFGLSHCIDGDIYTWIDAIKQSTPQGAIWLGWSLGGLIAMAAAIRYPAHIKGLVSVASSPCFGAKTQEPWPGISPKLLEGFASELEQDLPKTINSFLAIQAMGSSSAKSDIRALRKQVFQRPMPQPQALKQGLDMLSTVDLRSQVARISQPWLRMWGRLDTLVPQEVAARSQSLLSEDIYFAHASHGPFISHPQEFINYLTTWIEK